MTRPRWPGVTVLAFVALAATGLASQSVSPADVLARLRDYLDAYELELRSVIAEEHMRQWPMREAGSVYLGNTGGTQRPDSSRVRELRSDVAFVSLPGNAGWLGYRDVRRIGERPVRRKGPSLEDLLKATSDDSRERAMLLLLESARHNLGAPRTINLPSLPLELLHRRNEARYVVETTSADTIGACHAVRLDLAEMTRPTIIQRPEGGDMPTRVSAWVEPDSGRLCKAEVQTRDARVGVPAFTAQVTVEFAHDPGLNLTVPVRLDEVFFIPQRSRGIGEATYSNYRRFTTSGRLLPPG